MLSESDHADRVLTRIQERYDTQRDLLIYDEGKHIEASNCGDAWYRLNQFMLSANLLSVYRYGNRHIVPRITVSIRKWGKIIPLEAFGYNPKLRMARLERNYLNELSLKTCRTYMDNRSPSKHSTHGIVFGTGRKKTPPCIVAATFYWAPGRLLVDFNLRASEVTKTLGADFHFLNSVIQRAVPEWMWKNLGSVRIHLSMAYMLAQWFPLFDMIAPGYPLNPTDHKFHDMAMKSVRHARNIEGYESKWKPERRMHKFYRRKMNEFRASESGRIISGPSYFRRKKKHL